MLYFYEKRVYTNLNMRKVGGFSERVLFFVFVFVFLSFWVGGYHLGKRVKTAKMSFKGPAQNYPTSESQTLY